MIKGLTLQYLLLFFVAYSAFSNCIPSGPNLIINGDFSQGDTGFTSAYTYTNVQNGLYPAAYYAVGADVLFYHSGAAGHMYDHTFGNTSGSYFMANGSAVANTSFWC